MKVSVNVVCEFKSCRRKATHKWSNDRDDFLYVCRAHGEALEKRFDTGELSCIK